MSSNVSLPPVTVTYSDVFPTSGRSDAFLAVDDWSAPVHYFVGQNGTGKSRAARVISQRLNGRLLNTDRLTSVMNFTVYSWGSKTTAYKGVPLGEEDRSQMLQLGLSDGASEEIYALREQPTVQLRVAAFIRRALGRSVELRETAGYLDPFVRVQGVEYSLFREEGHGLRELVLLLAAVYKPEWSLLVVDEPELHLHPSMARLWVTELERECVATGRRAIVVTHEPSLIKPSTYEDLGALWHFAVGKAPSKLIDHILPVQKDRVTASLSQNPRLVSQLVFSPRPVLVEGIHDIAALSTSLSRTQPAEVVAQTDLVECGGDGGVGLWFEICSKLGMDIRGVMDLDACFDSSVQRVLDNLPEVQSGYETVLSAAPAKTSTALSPLIRAANEAQVKNDPKSRARWLADALFPTQAGNADRREKLFKIWKNAGLWLHPQGTLEDVLGIARKGAEESRTAASQSGPIDAVAAWCAYDLDPTGDLEFLLNAAVERIVHSIQEAIGLNPGLSVTSPVGRSADADARLVTVVPAGDGLHRVTVHGLPQFLGYWVEFSRDSRTSELKLNRPTTPSNPPLTRTPPIEP